MKLLKMVEMAIRQLLKVAVVSLFVVGLSVTALAGQQKLSAAQGQATPPPSQKNDSPEARARREAYVRYMEAQRLKSSQQLPAAIEAYKDTIRLDPTAAEPHADLGELYFLYMGRLSEAEHEAKEAVRLDPQNLDGRKLLARIYVFDFFDVQQRGAKPKPKPEQIERAISAYREVTKIESNNPEAWAFLARLYEMKNDTAKQLEALEKWSTAPASVDIRFYQVLTQTELSADQAYYQLAPLYLERGKKKEAIVAARRAYEMDPESSIYARNLINILRLAGNSQDELDTYTQLAELADSPPLQMGYASALVRTGHYAEAIEKLRGYLKADAANATIIGLLALAQRRANQRADAVETLKTGLTLVEPNARFGLTLGLGETYEEMGRTADAITQYEQLFESFASRGTLPPRSTDSFIGVLNRLVRAYRHSGNKEKVQDVSARAQKLLGDRNPQLDLLAIETLREDGKQREALDMTRLAARRYPDDRSFKLTEALILGEMSNFKEAIELLRSMIKGTAEEAAEDANVYSMMSNMQMQSGQLQAAEASIRKALTINPQAGDLLIQLSSVQDRNGQAEASEKTLRDILQREPDNATALNNLGYFLAEHGKRLEEARGLIEKAINIEPTNASFLDSLGWVHYKLGHLEQAREQLEKATSYARRNSTVYEHLGDVLRDLGRDSEARRQWEKALEYAVEAGETTRLKGKLKK